MKRFAAIASLLVLFGAGCAPSTPPLNPADITVPEPSPAKPPADPNQAFKPETSRVELPKILTADELKGKKAKIATAKGDFVIEFFGDTAPIAVSNFLSLAGKGFYDGVVFHRVCPNPTDGSCGGLEIVQGGDPEGTGRGGPGYKFQDELKDKYAYDRGIVAMANAGPNTNGSQFFIVKTAVGLPKAYTIFGKVVSGMDVVDKLVKGDKMVKVTVQ